MVWYGMGGRVVLLPMRAEPHQTKAGEMVHALDTFFVIIRWNTCSQTAHPPKHKFPAHPNLTPSTPSLTPTLTHNTASNLFNSGSPMAASAARPRYEWRISVEKKKKGGNGVSFVLQREKEGGGGRKGMRGEEQTRQIPWILAKAADGGVLGALEQVAPVCVEGGEVGFVEDLWGAGG